MMMINEDSKTTINNLINRLSLYFSDHFDRNMKIDKKSHDFIVNQPIIPKTENDFYNNCFQYFSKLSHNRSKYYRNFLQFF